MLPLLSLFFFFNDTATTEIYTLSLHDALPILQEGHLHLHGMLLGVGRVIDVHQRRGLEQRAREPLVHHGVTQRGAKRPRLPQRRAPTGRAHTGVRSEEHTSELQSQSNLVCRLLLEKKKKNKHS